MAISSSSLTGYTPRLFGVSRTALTDSGLGGGGDLFPKSLMCFMPLTSNLELFRGSGSATFTRSTTGTFIDPSTGIVGTAAVDVARFEQNGVLIEGASTNEAFHSRDFTNAVHVKENITAVKDATGADGLSNSASTLTATSANGTVFQTVPLGSAEYTFSIDVRRKTGSGTIEITDDGGFTLTDITTLINSNSYTRHTITTTQINPAIGIRIVTSGDEVEVDYEGLETLPFASSRIPTTTISVTRALDNLSINAANMPDLNLAYSIAMNIDKIGQNTARQRILHVSGVTNRTFRFTDSADTVTIFDSTSASAIIVTTDSLIGFERFVYTNDLTTVSAYIGNNVTSADFIDAPSGVKSFLQIGNALGADQLFGHIKDFRIYDVALSSDQVQSL